MSRKWHKQKLYDTGNCAGSYTGSKGCGKCSVRSHGRDKKTQNKHQTQKQSRKHGTQNRQTLTEADTLRMAAKEKYIELKKFLNGGKEEFYDH